MKPRSSVVRWIEPGQFYPTAHWYPEVQGKLLHPVVQSFLHMTSSQIADRYIRLHPRVHRKKLLEILSYRTNHYHWSGADTAHVTNERGKKQMILFESNSCPSGQKSMPPDDMNVYGGYQKVLRDTFLSKIPSPEKGKHSVLAVLYDKNPMENEGYAAALADLTSYPVLSVDLQDPAHWSFIRFNQGWMEVHAPKTGWIVVDAAFRYITQKPWSRLPVRTKTMIINPVIACLAGGRNKLVAAKAYKQFNRDHRRYGLKIITPGTTCDVTRGSIARQVARYHGQAVIKIPYTHAGLGVYTVSNAKELDAFGSVETPYKRFIVQSMVGHYPWMNRTGKKRYYHIGTIPDLDGHSYAYDLRIMVCNTPAGFAPVNLYARRASLPLTTEMKEGIPSWDILGTNLSYRTTDGKWKTDTTRLIPLDEKHFELLGLGLDDLIDGYIQAVLAQTAIDQMAQNLLRKKGHFNQQLFEKMDSDKTLLKEILPYP